MGKQLLGCGIQYKLEGVVLSLLLVITVIIMEISQQAPEASPFIGSPCTCERGSGVWGCRWLLGLLGRKRVGKGGHMLA